MVVILNAYAAIFVFCKRIHVVMGGLECAPTLLSSTYVNFPDPAFRPNHEIYTQNYPQPGRVDFQPITDGPGVRFFA